MVMKSFRAAVAATLLATVVLAGCSSTTDVTRSRLEAAVTPAFVNLYIQQAALLGIPNITPAKINPRTTCDRGGPKVADKGAGADWICLIHFTDNAGAP